MLTSVTEDGRPSGRGGFRDRFDVSRTLASHTIHADYI